MTIPASVTSIGDAVFGDCYSLTNIAVDAANPGYAGTGGVLFNKAMTTLVEYPAGVAGSYVVPDGVTNIVDYAFQSCSGLTSVTLPASLASIGAGFDWCYSLTNFTVNGASASYASAGGVLFDHAKTSLIEYPSGLAGSYDIPNGVTSLGVSAFAGCCSLTAVTIPSTVHNIGDSTFEYCYDLTNVVIPHGVTNIGNWAFADCYRLTNVTIPATVISLGCAVFDYCSNLKQACFLGNAPSANGGPGSADTSVFQGESGTVYCACDTAGWEGSFGGWPTAPGSYQSKPQLPGTGAGFGVLNHQFQFAISWAANTIVVVEASANLQSWTPVSTNTLVNGASAFTDSTWTNHPQQFYRVRSQ